MHRLSIVSAAVGAVAVVAAAPSSIRASDGVTGPCGVPSTKAPWQFAGPATYYARGDPLKITSAGAINNVALSAGGGDAADAWFVGSVNGGVWKTEDIGAKVPSYTNVLDGQPVACASIAALHVSSTKSTTIYAGCGGSTSSEEGADWNVMNSGDWGGLMVSTDRGATWSMTGFPANVYITAVLELADGTLVVSAQSHLYDATAGGIWRSTDGGASWAAVSSAPTFTLLAVGSGSGAVVATHAHAGAASRAASISTDSGRTWRDLGLGSAAGWGAGMIPFYTCATMLADGDTLVLGGLTVAGTNSSMTNSALFVTSVSAALANGPATAAWRKLPQPTAMDEDSMPKDRMAVLGDPKEPGLFYVAGNAGALAWRVNATTGTWTQLWDAPDVLDGSLPHGDCRNYAWDPATDRLLLVSDGGIFGRIQPRSAGGRWVSLNGDIKEMEYLTAHYDNREGRFVAGAQDNCAQVFGPPDTAATVAVGFVEGDGTVTAVDNVHNPARLYGTTQFLGVGTIDRDPHASRARQKHHANAGERDGDDDDDCGGLCFAQGDDFIGVPLATYFPEPASFPFFVHPFGLNSQDPSKLMVWVNGTNSSAPSAFYQFHIPDGVKDTDDIAAPQMVLKSPPGTFVLDFVYGGFTAGTADPSAIIAMSNAELFVRSAATGGAMVSRPLPASFAVPVTLNYAAGTGARILGPLSHGRTTSLAVAASDSAVVAVTGWPSIATNAGLEQVFVSHDAGKSWANLTAGLREATGVAGKTRAGGLLVVDLLANKARAILVSTTNGLMVKFVGVGANATAAQTKWTRFGSCSDFPLVLTSAVSYEHYSDTLVAATMGRGVYRLANAKAALLDARARLVPDAPAAVPERSSAEFFPLQK